MREVRLLLRLAKVVKTPREAAILLAAAAAIIAIAYVLPADIAE